MALPFVVSPHQKEKSSVCALFAQSDTDSIRVRVASGLLPGGREGDQNNSRSTKRGMAWIYRKYNRDRSLLALEQEARGAKRGFIGRIL
ncbi:MAG: hypothetical protein ACRDH5_07040 [bacterium]